MTEAKTPRDGGGGRAQAASGRRNSMQLRDSVKQRTRWLSTVEPHRVSRRLFVVSRGLMA